MPLKVLRGHTYAAPKWWLDEVRSLWDSIGFTDPAFAREMEEKLGWHASEHKIGRVRRGAVTTIEMMDAMSSVLGIPRPVVVTNSREEAQRIETARRLQKLPVIKAGAARRVGKDQTSTATSSDADASDVSVRRSRRRVERDRPPTPGR